MYLDSVERIARFLYTAVKRAVVNPNSLNTGDFITITRAEDDVVGVVEKVTPIDNAVDIILKTSSGTKTLRISSKNFIHIIQKKADMLNLRKHTDYERDLKDMTKEDHQRDRRPEYGPEEKSDKSELPTSKISLVLKQKKDK